MAKILIIDDSVDLLQLFQRILSGQKNEVRLANSLASAEEQLADMKPDLVFLDVNLQQEDGRQLSYVLANDYKIPVILISGDATKLEHHSRYGAVAVMEKPLGRTNILAHVETFKK